MRGPGGAWSIDINGIGGEKMRRRFDVLAASHGAAGVGLITLFGCAGVLTLLGLESRRAIGISLILVATAYAVAMLFFGFFTRTGDSS